MKTWNQRIGKLPVRAGSTSSLMASIVANAMANEKFNPSDANARHAKIAQPFLAVSPNDVAVANAVKTSMDREMITQIETHLKDENGPGASSVTWGCLRL